MPDADAASTSSLFTVATAPEGARWRLQLKGEFDVAGLETAQRALDEALSERCASLVIDLSDLTFMDSTGLRFVIGAQRLCAGAGRGFAVRQGGPTIQRLFELTRLDAVVPFEH